MPTLNGLEEQVASAQKSMHSSPAFGSDGLDQAVNQCRSIPHMQTHTYSSTSTHGHIDTVTNTHTNNLNLLQFDYSSDLGPVL